MALEELYTQQIIELSKNPRNKGVLADATVKARAENKSCGDSLTLYLALHGSTIQDVSFEGVGCAISQAAASLLTDMLRGHTLAEARLLTPGDVYTLIGIPISPGRTKCALLAYSALSRALTELS